MIDYSKIVHGVLRPFWRATRGLTLGAQGVVLDEQSRVLLVRHSYRPGWHFPGGGVEWNETIEQALARELEEEAGIIMGSTPDLHGVFANFKKFPGDHIAVFLVQDWQQYKKPVPNAEIRESGFFFTDRLPEGTVEGVNKRLAEIFKGAPIDKNW